MTTFTEMVADLANDELPKSVDAYQKIKTDLKPGMRVGWYFKEDKEFWDGDGLDCRKSTQYSGILVPAPDVEMRGGIMEADDCVIVMDSYPVEKEYCEATWFALRRLLDNEDLVELFAE
jgi:hypothetical protein